MVVMIIDEQRDHEFEGEWRRVYGEWRVWRGKREGRNVVIKIQSQKQTVKIKQNDM